MKSKLSFLIVLAFFACNNANRPITDLDKEKNITDAKNLISTIYQAAESIDSLTMTSTFLDSPDFISFINGEYANYDQTKKKKIPVLDGGIQSSKSYHSQ